MKQIIFIIGIILGLSFDGNMYAQTPPMKSYCNPVDIDYTYMSHYAFRGVSYRSGADPAVILKTE